MSKHLGIMTNNMGTVVNLLMCLLTVSGDDFLTLLNVCGVHNLLTDLLGYLAGVLLGVLVALLVLLVLTVRTRRTSSATSTPRRTPARYPSKSVRRLWTPHTLRSVRKSSPLTVRRHMRRFTT